MGSAPAFKCNWLDGLGCSLAYPSRRTISASHGITIGSSQSESNRPVKLAPGISSQPPSSFDTSVRSLVKTFPTPNTASNKLDQIELSFCLRLMWRSFPRPPRRLDVVGVRSMGLPGTPGPPLIIGEGVGTGSRSGPPPKAGIELGPEVGGISRPRETPPSRFPRHAPPSQAIGRQLLPTTLS